MFMLLEFKVEGRLDSVCPLQPVLSHGLKLTP